MEQYERIACPHCGGHDLYKNGKNKQGKRRYHCKSCGKYFITDYSYNGCKPSTKKQIDEMLLNSSGTRDISRVLKISTNTVSHHIKKKTLNLNPNYTSAVHERIEVELKLATEWDEFWSYVGKKCNQRWTWYLLNRENGDIIAWQNGRRTDEVFLQLLERVKHLPIEICHTDNWAAYARYFPECYTHLIGKEHTWRIERRNLNFRTHIKRLSRKTICFSKREDLHDKVMSMYIERYYFQPSIFNRKTAYSDY